MHVAQRFTPAPSTSRQAFGEGLLWCLQSTLASIVAAVEGRFDDSRRTRSSHTSLLTLQRSSLNDGLREDGFRNYLHRRRIACPPEHTMHEHSSNVGACTHFLCPLLPGLWCAGKPFAMCIFCACSCCRTRSLRISHLPRTCCAERLTLQCISGSL
ncbi:hypothetical protein C7974DRAFT_31886 [Boeremia exigua]|uniref:uncharacterized protein n=1 Tax=Boeremia exigua TaxID=749465 RepID=UPI001E8E603E|nr:uncharacterized protein C7974DRAFT_31886 [Boeremia exigua]KAH6618534.1 hypothetical protein C7974DRAFT_31886 [Boeremia exigua]